LGGGGHVGGQPAGGGQYGGQLAGHAPEAWHSAIVCPLATQARHASGGGQFGGHGWSATTRTIRLGPFPLAGFAGSATIFPSATYSFGTSDSATDHPVGVFGACMHPATAAACHAPSAATSAVPRSVHDFCWSATTLRYLIVTLN
jgi:hypothetical protein